MYSFYTYDKMSDCKQYRQLLPLNVTEHNFRESSMILEAIISCQQAKTRSSILGESHSVSRNVTIDSPTSSGMSVSSVSHIVPKSNPVSKSGTTEDLNSKKPSILISKDSSNNNSTDDNCVPNQEIKFELFFC